MSDIGWVLVINGCTLVVVAAIIYGMLRMMGLRLRDLFRRVP